MLAVADPTDDGPIVSVFDDDGTPLRVEELRVDEEPTVAAVEAAHHPRWIFDSAIEEYPHLLAAGIRIRRCHDISLAERVLASRSGEFGRPIRAAAVLARAAGRPVPDDPPPVDPRATAPSQLGLFDSGADRRPGRVGAADLVAAYADQQRRIGDSATGAAAAHAGILVDAGALRLLLAGESGSALVAAEMTVTGMPWDPAIHERILIDRLGPRPAAGARPARMAELAERITEAFGFPVNPDSALELKAAFSRVGIEVDSTRAWVLRDVEHPAVAPLLAYKDLARLHSANGWNWLDEWVADGRLVSEYLPGAVVSGRWATRGGGGLQIPKAIRGAAVARPGYRLVVADGAQLEPRIWAARSRDAGLLDAAQGDDMYAAIAAEGFGGDRRHAKLAMLGGMYGQTSGEAARLMATMRVRYPDAVAFVETAARRGESGAVVQSVLGRACPPPSPAWWALHGASEAGSESAARRAARDRGRFTRNFVIQASAADWAGAWMSVLRLGLMDLPGAELVLFQHDELVLHVPADYADDACELAMSAARTATRLVFPGTTVRIPVRPTVVTCYADAK